MNNDTVIGRRLREITTLGGYGMPYNALLRKLQDRYDKERNPDKRERLEIEMVLLLGIIEIQRGITTIVNGITRSTED